MKKQAEPRLSPSTRRTRKAVFLGEVKLVVPSREFFTFIAAASPVASTGRSPFACETTLRIQLPSAVVWPVGPGHGRGLFETPLYRDFAGLTSAQRIRQQLENHELSIQILATVNSTLAAKGLLLKSGTGIDSTLIAAPSSTRDSSGERDPEMHQPKKGNQWHSGMKAHLGVDADSGLVHTVVGTAANVNDLTQVSALVHGEEIDFGGVEIDQNGRNSFKSRDWCVHRASLRRF